MWSSPPSGVVPPAADDATAARTQVRILPETRSCSTPYGRGGVDDRPFLLRATGRAVGQLRQQQLAPE